MDTAQSRKPRLGLSGVRKLKWKLSKPVHIVLKNC
nr:MAG TPA: hypothetical protein [Caudoviricetes sp.]DAN40408.1 MAG TPA: hypothetical protein [Caudoviricetes sp.]